MRADLIQYQPQIDILVRFVEGLLDGQALEAGLATQEMKSLLGVFENPRYPAMTNHFRKLHNNQDRSTLGGLVNSEGIIEDFLKKAEVDFQPAKRYSKAYSLILKSVPEYLDPPPDFMIEKIIPHEDQLSDAQTKKIIKERLKEYFKYVEKPPKWIQSPDWPSREGKPLVFVGQIEIDASDLFHDVGAAYVFFDPEQGRFETLAQFH